MVESLAATSHGWTDKLGVLEYVVVGDGPLVPYVTYEDSTGGGAVCTALDAHVVVLTHATAHVTIHKNELRRGVSTACAYSCVCVCVCVSHGVYACACVCVCAHVLLEKVIQFV